MGPQESVDSSKPQQSIHRAKVESIQIVTSISSASVYEDGSITPTPATVVGTSVFESGVLAATVRQDPGLLNTSNTSAIVELSNAEGLASSSSSSSLSAAAGVPLALLAPGVAPASVSTASGVSSRSTSPNPGVIEQQQQQQQQQQQRQRELHYESANAVLVPPLNFALVAPGVYRSGHPNKHNFPFMKKLGLKVIVQMSEEPYAPDLVEFLEQENIRRIHYKIEGNKEPFIEIDEEVIRSALVNILDARNHPLLIHCAKGKHRIGCLIGCLRKIQNWSMTSIFDEYRRFAGSKVLADQEFIEIFPAKVPYLLEYKPEWL
ncbi:hypothetical protein BGX23_009069 [Mortierella sp. AD031]|nr:hypothetical protein BGX23_009069 [Mortierella sp. AD031]